MTHSTVASAREYATAMIDQLSQLDCEAIERYVDLLYQAWDTRRRVFVFGNGGSSFTASHHVCDYVKTAAVAGRPRLLAFSLTDNMGLTTAVGNDVGYDETLRYPLESYAQPGDLAVAISSSGKSPNVVRACAWAREHSLTVVALTGFDGGDVAALADVHIHVPSDNYGVIEDVHMCVGHISAQMLHGRVHSRGTRA